MKANRHIWPMKCNNALFWCLGFTLPQFNPVISCSDTFLPSFPAMRNTKRALEGGWVDGRESAEMIPILWRLAHDDGIVGRVVKMKRECCAISITSLESWFGSIVSVYEKYSPKRIKRTSHQAKHCNVLQRVLGVQLSMFHRRRESRWPVEQILRAV